MKITRMLSVLAVLPLLAPALRAQDHQDKPSGAGAPAAQPAESAPLVPLKVEVVFSEFDGKKVVGRSPYMMRLLDDGRENLIRMAINQNPYVSTDIECMVKPAGEDRYTVDVRFTRQVPEALPPSPDENPSASKPRIEATNDVGHLTLIMRDGETAEAGSAVDPITGHVLKTEVTLTVLK